MTSLEKDNFIIEVSACEQQRCAALLSKDYSTLEVLISEQLVHTHASGKTETKTSYLKSISSRASFLSINRSNLTFRVFDGAVIVTGSLVHSAQLTSSDEIRKFSGIATQVWAKENGQWKQNTFHASRLAE